MITADQVETIRLHWGIRRPDIQAHLKAAQTSQPVEPEQVTLGHTRWGGAFVLSALLIQKAWLQAASCLTLAMLSPRNNGCLRPSSLWCVASVGLFTWMGYEMLVLPS